MLEGFNFRESRAGFVFGEAGELGFEWGLNVDDFGLFEEGGFALAEGLVAVVVLFADDSAAAVENRALEQLMPSSGQSAS